MWFPISHAPTVPNSGYQRHSKPAQAVPLDQRIVRARNRKKPVRPLKDDGSEVDPEVAPVHQADDAATSAVVL